MEVDRICELMNRHNIKYTDFKLLYPFLTENFKSISEHFDFKDKNILSVCGASDQILDMILLGSKNITAFDINSLTEHYYNLKKAFLLSNLDLEEYLDFFCGINNYYVFNKSTFNLIKDYIDETSFEFWTYIFNHYSSYRIRKARTLFNNDERTVDVIKELTNYLSEENFNKLKKAIEDVDFNFINCNITELSDNLSSKYDFIYLSNIIQYTSSLFNNEESDLYKELLDFKKIIMDLSKYLNKDGSIMAGYIYTPEDTHSNHAIFVKSIREKVFKKDFYYLTFPSVMSKVYNVTYNDEIHDKALIYRKMNKTTIIT